MTDWIFTLPFLVSLLWAAGGREGGRYFRRIGVGLAIGFYCYLYTKNLIGFTCIFTYWIVTSIGYGKLIKNRNWPVLYLLGIFYGLACWPICAITGSKSFILQGSISAAVFTGLTYWSNTGRHKIHWALTEGLTGLAASILIPRMIIA